MNTLESVFHWVMEASWQASLLAVAVLAAQWIFRPWLNPRWRHALWLLVLLRLILPALPESPISAQAWAPVPQPEVLIEKVYHPVALVGEVTLVTEEGDAPSSDFHVSLMSLLAFVWCVGAIAWGAVVLWVNLGFARHVMSLPAETESRILEIYAGACALLGVARPPRLVPTGRVSSPALMGLVRPAILLPKEGREHYTDEELRLIFLHELAHLKRGDQFIQWLITALQVVHWFNPVLWFAFRRIRLDREPATDAYVLSRTGEEWKEPYGMALLRVLEHHHQRHALSTLVGIMEDRSELKSRFRLISLFNRKAYAWSAVAVLLMLVLGGVFLTREARAKVQALMEVSNTTEVTAQILAAARAGDGKTVTNLVLESSGGPLPLDDKAAKSMLDTVVTQRDLPAFKVLLGQLRQTTIGIHWQADDTLLEGLVRDGRRDFVEILLLDPAEPLVPGRLEALAPKGDAGMAGWIRTRVVEVRKQKQDEEALLLASMKGDLPSMRRLIAAGVDVNCVARDHHTPLTHAASQGKAEAVRLLLESGAEVDKPKLPGWDYTPLCLAKTVEVAEILKAHGANVHAKLFKRDVSILTYVVTFGGPDMTAWFLAQGLDPHMIGDNKQTLLFYVGDAASAKILLDAGVDPNAVDEDGRTALQEARNGDVARLLLAHGAKTASSTVPLLLSMINRSDAKAIEAVLNQEPKPDAETIQRALLEAANAHKADVVEVLIRYGADPNKEMPYPTEDRKMSALMMCTMSAPAEVAEMLLKHGADPNGGKRPGQYLKNALANGNKAVARVLWDAGSKGVAELAYRVAMQDEAEIKTLLNSAPGYADNPDFWKDVLPSAARRGDLRAVRACLDKGVPLADDASLKRRDDAFEAAAGEGQDEVLEVLLAHRKPDADPNELRGALWAAAWNSCPYPNQRSAEHFEKSVQLLLAAGAPVKDAGFGVNPVTAAVFSRYPNGNARVIDMLVAAGADPNPMINDKERLTEAIQKAYDERGRIDLSADTVAAVERHNRIKFTVARPAEVSSGSPTTLEAFIGLALSPYQGLHSIKMAWSSGAIQEDGTWITPEGLRDKTLYIWEAGKYAHTHSHSQNLRGVLYTRELAFDGRRYQTLSDPPRIVSLSSTMEQEKQGIPSWLVSSPLFAHYSWFGGLSDNPIKNLQDAGFAPKIIATLSRYEHQLRTESVAPFGECAVFSYTLSGPNQKKYGTHTVFFALKQKCVVRTEYQTNGDDFKSVIRVNDLTEVKNGSGSFQFPTSVDWLRYKDGACTDATRYEVDPASLGINMEVDPSVFVVSLENAKEVHDRDTGESTVNESYIGPDGQVRTPASATTYVYVARDQNLSLFDLGNPNIQSPQWEWFAQTKRYSVAEDQGEFGLSSFR